MLPDKILQSDLLDILFENKNKTYGAYLLRKTYNNTLRTSITITIFICACFAITLLLHHNPQQELSKTIFIPQSDIIKLAPPETPKPVQPAQQPITHVRQVNTSTPVIAPDDVKITQPTIDKIDQSIISNVNSDGEAPTENAAPGISSNTGITQATSTTVSPVVDNDKPISFAQVMPMFPGGTDALIKFMQRNLKQPDDLEENQSIKVIASFVVSKTGEIENLKIINSGRTDLDKEVLRVINKMPLWKPGLQNGKPVAVYFNLPVTFMSVNE